MTPAATKAYCPPMQNGWQHKGSFVIKFRPDTDAAAGRFSGRVEHVASNQTTRFDSLEELLEFLHRVLKKVRIEFQQTETQADDFRPVNDS